MNFLTRLFSASLLTSVALTAFAQNRTFSGQYSFGDSLSDSGNLYALTGRTLPPAPYFAGRFSNGPVFTELLGNPLLAAAPLFSRGRYLNFAVGGASAVLTGPVPNLAQQIGIYRVQGFAPERDDLFTVLAGANDLIPALSSPSVPANPALLDSVSAGIAQVVAANVQSLVSLGAKNIVVAGLPNLGATPRALAAGGQGGAGALLGLRATSAYNNELRSRLQTLADAAPDVNLVYVDLQGFLDRVATDYQALGFANATSFYLAPAAQGGGVGDPNSYVFWDDIHPTARTHALFAAYVLEHLNPEPTLGFAATQGTAALALHGLAAGALDSRVSQLAASRRIVGRADAYASYNYGDGVRGREGWRPKFDFDAHVATAGVDLHVTDGIFIGGSVNGGRLEAQLGSGRGEFTIEDGTGRLYGVWRGGPVSLILDGSYGVVKVKGIERPTAFGGLATRGKTSGDQWGAGMKAMWSVDVGAVNVRPWAGLRTARVQLDSYTERDVPGLAMAFAAQDAESSTGSVGVDASLNFRVGLRAARFDVRGAWHGELGSDDRTVAGRLANNITRDTLLAIEDGDGDGLDVGGAVTLFFAQNWSASVGYTADIRDGERLTNKAMISLQTGF